MITIFTLSTKISTINSFIIVVVKPVICLIDTLISGAICNIVTLMSLEPRAFKSCCLDELVVEWLGYV